MYNVMVRGVPLTWGISAVGSAPHWQCGGHGFESRMLHQAGNAPQRDRRATALRFLFSLKRSYQKHNTHHRQPPRRAAETAEQQLCGFFFPRHEDVRNISIPQTARTPRSETAKQQLCGFFFPRHEDVRNISIPQTARTTGSGDCIRYNQKAMIFML